MSVTACSVCPDMECHPECSQPRTEPWPQSVIDALLERIYPVNRVPCAHEGCPVDTTNASRLCAYHRDVPGVGYRWVP